MLDKLVESKNNGRENKRLSGFLMTTFMTMAFILTFGLIYSLFSQTLILGSGDLDAASLIAPVAFEPETPEPQKQVKQPSEKVSDKIISRVVNMQRPNESPIEPPTSVSVNQNKYQARPDAPFVLSAVDSTPTQAVSTVGENISGGNMKSLSNTIKPNETTKKVEIETPPVIKQTPKPIVKKVEPSVSGGVVNSKAINLVKPVYSATARAMRVGGEVKVQVTIDEDGNVIAANAVSGNPLLRNSAEIAAKSSKFTPTTLSKQRVKVTGIIIYNFAVQ
ncbi:MAG: TonB family protein [Acidobacteriota bacterium]